MNCPLCNSNRVYSERCERCGAQNINGKWVLVCQRCSKEVKELHGLFVPHLCKTCMEEVIAIDRKTGNICGMCRAPRSLCCC